MITMVKTKSTLTEKNGGKSGIVFERGFLNDRRSRGGPYSDLLSNQDADTQLKIKINDLS